MPTRHFSRLSMASDVQTRPSQVPSTKVGLAKWLEEYCSKLEMAVKLGCALEPRVIMRVLTDAVARVIHEDAILKRVLYGEISQPSLRNLNSVWDVLPFVRVMTGE
eukprot:162917-Prorocentrum_lima.AAC.1